MIDFSNKKEVISKLQKLKGKKLPHMTIEQFSRIDKGFAEDIKNAKKEELKIISEKLSPFYRTEEGDNKCIFSDEFPSLRWGLTHGIATDERTGLAWKHYHYFDINGKTQKYERTLQYHPDNYEIEED
ncbi:hypothetical protein [Clostridium botulinum]|uniref:hypothetical protein n=1 Tax=Clostridium botulinum TaxID=1491 RepID=UPI0009474CCA|nr:hypothetical protein [Clostridium botulinum]APQ78580.1 hypothetical protein RSJ10_3764 [Clostridium botulinum]MBN3355825.1 hypothetical protein [Clostridium botulinum]